MKLDFSKFYGEIPKTPLYDLPHNFATTAMNVDLRTAQPRAWREPTLQYMVEDARSFLVHGCHYLAWDECVTAVPTTVNADTILLVGRKPYAEQLRLNGSNKEYARLGLPIPPRPTAVGKAEEHKKDTYPTSYVITYENKYGQESGPSPASNIVNINEETGVDVLVQGFPTNALAEYRITAVHIYRLAHPYRSGEEEDPLAEDSIYIRVGSVSFGQESFRDNKLTIDAGVPLMTDEVREAPQGMQSIKAIPGTNSYVGFRGHMIHFSENNRFWNWPASFDMTLDRNIKHIEVVGDKLLVSTTGGPYIISDLQTCEKRKCRPVDELALGNIGDIGCDALYGSVATPYGMVYATVDGIAILNANGKFSLLSSGFYTAEQWGKLRPDSCKFAYWSGLLLCSTDVTSFFIRLDAETFNTEGTEGLSRIDDEILGLKVNTDGQLFLLKSDGIYHWNSSNEFREFIWENKHIGADMRQTLSAYRGHGDNVEVSIIGNQTGEQYDIYRMNHDAERVSRLGRNNNYTLRLQGTGFVTYFILGSSILEVSRAEGA